LSRIQSLYQLQLLDTNLDQTRKELVEVKAALGESEALKQARAAVASSEEVMHQAQTKMRDLELGVNGLATKITQQEKLLYSGKTMSPKEAANLQEEVASLKRWHGTREELLLEAMMAAEEAEEAFRASQARLAEVEAGWSADQAALRQKQGELENKLAELQERRPTLTASLKAEDLAEYDTLRRKRAGRAVTIVKNGVCQGCGIAVSQGKLQRARADQELMFCGTCGRILYVP
jgi:predicted  nucleic acid-binding Zn-ribbon protein